MKVFNLFLFHSIESMSSKRHFSELRTIVEKINNFQIILLKFPHLYDILELTICEVYYGKLIRKDT